MGLLSKLTEEQQDQVLRVAAQGATSSAVAMAKGFAVQNESQSGGDAKDTPAPKQ